MINDDFEFGFSTKHLPLEYKLLEWKLIINQELYNNNIIDSKIKSEMGKNILKKMTIIKNKYNKLK